MDDYDDYNCECNSHDDIDKENEWVESQKFLAQTISAWSEKYNRVCRRLESVQKEYQSWAQDSRHALKKAHAERNDALKEVASLKSYHVVGKAIELSEELETYKKKCEELEWMKSTWVDKHDSLEEEVARLTHELVKLKNSI